MDGLEFAWYLLLAPSLGGGLLLSATTGLGYAAGCVGAVPPERVPAGAGWRAAGTGAAVAALRLLGLALALVALWAGTAAVLPWVFEFPRACAAWLLGSFGPVPAVAAAIAVVGFTAGARARAARAARGGPGSAPSAP